MFKDLSPIADKCLVFIDSNNVTSPDNISPHIIQKEYLTRYQKVFYTITYDELVVGYLLSGLLLMMIFSNAVNFRLSRKKDFFYNCCYAICIFGLIFLILISREEVEFLPVFLWDTLFLLC